MNRATNVFWKSLRASDRLLIILLKNTILANDLGEHMKHAVKLLSNRQREVFELSRHHMLTNKEIAEQLNISISTVQDHLSASLKIIRTYFKKEGFAAY